VCYSQCSVFPSFGRRWYRRRLFTIGELLFEVFLNVCFFQDCFCCRLHINISAFLHSSSPLNLGKPIEIAGTNATNVFVLTTHSIHPHFSSELKLYQEGFILTKFNKFASVPMIIQFAKDVSKMWTIDALDCFQEAIRCISGSDNGDKTSSWLSTLYRQYENYIPNGILLIFELKASTENKHSTALHQAFPNIFLNATHSLNQKQCLAVFFPHNDRNGSILPFFIEKWKVAVRMNDIEDMKGKANYSTISKEILLNYLIFLDSLKLFYNDERNRLHRTTAGKEGGEEELVTNLEFSKILQFLKEFSVSGFPLYGFYSMKCFHSIGEARRLSSFDYVSLLFDHEGKQEERKDEGKESDRPHHSKMEIMIMNGFIGTGIHIISKQFIQQLQASVEQSLTENNKHLEFFHLDFNRFILESHNKDVQNKELKDFIQQELSASLFKLHRHHVTSSKLVLFLIMTLNPILPFSYHDLLQEIVMVTRSPITHITTVLTPDNILSTNNNSNDSADPSLDTSSFQGIGKEYWNSYGMELLHYYSCHNVILLESSSQSPAYQKLKNYLEVLQNGSIHLMKLSSFNIYFESEDIQYFSDLVLKSQSSNNTDQEEEDEWKSSQLAYGLPTFSILKEKNFHKEDEEEEKKKEKEFMAFYSSKFLIPKQKNTSSFYSFLQTISFDRKELFSNLSAHDHRYREFFSLTLFLKCLQFVFPRAVVMSKPIVYDLDHQNTADHEKKIKKVTGKFAGSSYHSLLHHAMRKVFQQKELKEMTSLFEEMSQSLVKSSSLIQTFRNMISVQAILTLDNERVATSAVNTNTNGRMRADNNSRQILIEANQGNIIFRELSTSPATAVTASLHANEIIITGLLKNSKEEKDQLLSFFQLSQQYYLKPKPLLSKEDYHMPESSFSTSQATTSHGKLYHLGRVQKLQTMNAYSSRPLPPGYWYDGQFYLDHQGQRYELRPDIDEIIQDYMERENKKRSLYNSWLEELYL
jgi:hypothetical protein